ncbi:MAG: 4Fe-4S cluster-binding domain-containing protein [Desulfuromonadaceae bacterium]|nr:4Fe-4S cluster-binding domain-containing protein [Desulfuromonadaceae bacterium]
MSRTFCTYNLNNLDSIRQVRRLPEDLRLALNVVGRVFPFRTNNYMVDELIDWDNAETDPIFHLNFPCREMLFPEHYDRISGMVRSGASTNLLRDAVQDIRHELNPQSVHTMDATLPAINGRKQHGIVHSYPETVLFFPAEGQMCHAHCTFCFRWLQFVGEEEDIFASTDVESLISYVSQHQEVRDILFTGGDPLFMRTDILAGYVDRILEADIPHLNAIRFGTKAITYWPYRFLTNPDADALLVLFEKIIAKGKHVAVVANINHPREISTDAAQKAIKRIRSTGAEIRAQSPLLRHINDKPEIWSALWREEVRQGVVPYYQFVVRDTGARHYFALPLVEALEIYREAYSSVSGICRTVRGPCMSTPQGKVQLIDVQELQGEKTLLLHYIQTPFADQVLRTFFAVYDEKAEWFTDLKPLRPEDASFFRNFSKQF